MANDLKQRTKPKEINQPNLFASNPSPSGSPGHPGRRQKPVRCGDSDGESRRFSLDQGSLDSYSAELLSWVANKCPEDGWNHLIGRSRELGSPPWLNPAAVGLDDQLDHQILALALAHSICLYVGIQDPPLPKGDDLECGLALHRLGLVPPVGIQQLATRLSGDGPLRQLRLLNVEENWNQKRRRGEDDSFSVGRFLRTRFSLNIHALGKLIEKQVQGEQVKGPLLDDLVLAEEVRETVGKLIQNPPVAGKAFCILLKGPEGYGRRSLARAMAAQLGMPLREINPFDGPQPGCCVLVGVSGSFDEDDWEKIQDQQGIVFFRESNGRGGLEVEGLVDLVLDLGALDVATMISFCFKVLKDAGPLFQEVDPFDVGRSGISPGKLVRAIKRLQAETQWRSHSPSDTKNYMDRAVQITRDSKDSSRFVEQIEPTVALKDLCLPPQLMERFERMVRSIKGRKQMLEQWGLDPAVVGRAQGICLLTGGPGVGKSFSALALSAELGFPLWRIQASELESPYVGESESRLHKLFQDAKGKDVVLLLDEAEVVLAERSRAEGSTRRYQMSLANAWLRELDEFNGVLIMTSNQGSDFDPAVERRIQFRLEFPNPDGQVRAQIWANLFRNARIPGKDTLDLAAVAERYPLSGGLIRNAFVGACQRASEAGAISQEILLQAVEEEHRSALPSKRAKPIRGFAALADSPREGGTTRG
ncbi:MAG: AAA family ATPase [Holophaga sp.]